MRVNKFILVERNDGAELRLGCVENHADLLRAGEKCLGGGFFKVSDALKRVVMWDKSHDFGYPDFSRRTVLPDGRYRGYSFYCVPDLFMPMEDYEVTVEVV